jgi:hypothetical protein
VSIAALRTAALYSPRWIRECAWCVRTQRRESSPARLIDQQAYVVDFRKMLSEIGKCSAVIASEKPE